MALAGAILAAITPAVPLAAAFWPTAFGLETAPEDDVVMAVSAFVEAAGTIAGAFRLRRFVTPGDTPGDQGGSGGPDGQPPDDDSASTGTGPTSTPQQA